VMRPLPPDESTWSPRRPAPRSTPRQSGQTAADDQHAALHGFSLPGPETSSGVRGVIERLLAQLVAPENGAMPPNRCSRKRLSTGAAPRPEARAPFPSSSPGRGKRTCRPDTSPCQAGAMLDVGQSGRPRN
jgi:hypothetical protein